MTERSTRLLCGFPLPSRDPSRSRDPRVRALVRELAQLPAAPAPSTHFRAELRTQLVAVAPRLVAEGSPVAEPSRRAATQRSAPGRAANGSSVLRRLASVRVGRPVAAVLGGLCVFVLLLGGAVWISGKAMPGDTLYQVKRATENARLALASNDTDKAKYYLSFAKTRAGEVADLLGQPTAAALAGGDSATGGVSAHTAKLVGTTFDSADGDVRDASQLLTGKAVHDRNSAPLAIMIQWAPGQLSRLQHIAARLPSGAVLDRVHASATLVRAALARAEQLRSGIGCSCLASAPSDQLGPVPCSACAPVVPAQGGTTAPPPASSIAPRQAPGSPAQNAPAGSTTAPQPGGASPRTRPTGGASSSKAGNAAPAPGAGSPAGNSEPSGRSGTGSGSHSAPGGGSTASTTEPAAPSGGASSPQPSRTCLIVLLGICI